MTAALHLIGGAGLLVLGAELLVRGGSRMAAAAGISPLMIGLTVVAFGTSAPELAVSLGATFAGEPDIAVGNVVGSNIFNVLLILGLSALIVPLVVQRQLVRVDVPIMIAASVVLLIMGNDGTLDGMDGALLVGALLAYLVFLSRQSRAEAQARASENGPTEAVAAVPARGHLLIAGIMGAVGLALLVSGSNLFVRGAVTTARLLGVSEVVVGLTIIAAGTSLPELATSILASLRGERDIAVGNVIGSNIFNIFGILGLCALLAPDGVAVADSVRTFDGPVMLAVAVATLPIFFTGLRISRGEAVVFLVYYAAYTAYLVLNAAGHDALDGFGRAMLVFVVPLTLVTLLGTVKQRMQPAAF